LPLKVLLSQSQSAISPEVMHIINNFKMKMLFVRLQQYWMIQKHTGKECWDWQVEFTVCRNIATF
jgi:hypothetical protein